MKSKFKGEGGEGGGGGRGAGGGVGSPGLKSWKMSWSASRGGGVTPLRAPTPLCQNRVCLTRGVSPGAYRGAQGRSLKNTWKMFVFNCMIHFVTCIVTIFPITELLGYP